MIAYLDHKILFYGYLVLTGVFIDGNTFQNRNVSSPAPVTIVCGEKKIVVFICLLCIREIYSQQDLLFHAAVPGHQVIKQDRAPANCGQLKLQPVEVNAEKQFMELG